MYCAFILKRALTTNLLTNKKHVDKTIILFLGFNIYIKAPDEADLIQYLWRANTSSSFPPNIYDIDYMEYVWSHMTCVIRD